jgi:dTDP-4-amino-4,6-dideoxygalactose transaminase
MNDKPVIPLFKVNMPAAVIEPLTKVLLSGYIGQGEKVKEFETLLAEYIGNPRVLTVNSGTSAIHLALRLAGVGPGDEVISTPMTCTATNEPILERGARIVWADINPLTGEIDPWSVATKLTQRTKAIICVHWAGYPCDLTGLNGIAKLFNLKVIEDAAHAFGAVYRDGRLIGNHSDFVCFSFQAIKHFTTVDGGALLCRSEEDYRRGKLLRWYGIDRDSPRTVCRCEDDIKEYGYKFHMNDINATIGIVQLRSGHASLAVSRHFQHAETLANEIRGLGSDEIQLPAYDPYRRSAYWVFPLLVKRKPEFIEHMTKAGIMVSMVHKRNDIHTMMAEFRCPSLPGVDAFEQTHVAIPCGWWLTPESEDRIIEALAAFVKGAGR